MINVNAHAAHCRMASIILTAQLDANRRAAGVPRTLSEIDTNEVKMPARRGGGRGRHPYATWEKVKVTIKIKKTNQQRLHLLCSTM